MDLNFFIETGLYGLVKLRGAVCDPESVGEPINEPLQAIPESAVLFCDGHPSFKRLVCGRIWCLKKRDLRNRLVE